MLVQSGRLRECRLRGLETSRLVKVLYPVTRPCPHATRSYGESYTGELFCAYSYSYGQGTCGDRTHIFMLTPNLRREDLVAITQLPRRALAAFCHRHHSVSSWENNADILTLIAPEGRQMSLPAARTYRSGRQIWLSCRSRSKSPPKKKRDDSTSPQCTSTGCHWGRTLEGAEEFVNNHRSSAVGVLFQLQPGSKSHICE